MKRVEKDTNEFTQAVDTALQDLAARVLPALVVVKSSRGRTGAGVIWRADGLIVTTYHVLGDHPPQVQLDDGRRLDAQVLAGDADIDLALLAVEAHDLSVLPCDEHLPRVGEMVFAFGHPWGQRGMVTHGVVSAHIQAETQSRRSLTLLRSDVPLAPGSSGGPLVTAGGRLAGINNMIVGGDQSMSIPAGAVLEFVNEYLSKTPG